jgi:hypothetical protein
VLGAGGGHPPPGPPPRRAAPGGAGREGGALYRPYGMGAPSSKLQAPSSNRQKGHQIRNQLVLSRAREAERPTADLLFLFRWGGERGEPVGGEGKHGASTQASEGTRRRQFNTRCWRVLRSKRAYVRPEALVSPGSRKEHRSPTNPFVMLYGPSSNHPLAHVVICRSGAWRFRAECPGGMMEPHPD